MTSYYNEWDPFAAQWTQNLMDAGHIPPGEIDTRSIDDVRPDDLRGFHHVHLFSGIAGWALALRIAGVPDDFGIWSASCPCQPFSDAGKGGGFDDERHKWPAAFHLIGACRPERIIGEQVSSKDGLGWFDLVQDDLEAADYTSGGIDICAAGIGSPQIRQRLYWMAFPNNPIGRPGPTGGHERHGPHARWAQGAGHAQGCGGASGVANAGSTRTWRDAGTTSCTQAGLRGPRGANGFDSSDAPFLDGAVCWMAQPGSSGLGVPSVQCGQPGRCDAPAGGWGKSSPLAVDWRNADWLLCRDPDGPRWRPVEPFSFPLDHGLPRGLGRLPAELQGLARLAGLDSRSLARAKACRTGGLRGAGNAIVPELAAQFIAVALEHMP